MDYAFVIAPGTYTAFDSEADQMDMCKQWGLLSEKAAKPKTYVYKKNGKHLPCSIVGYVDAMTAVIELDNQQRHCIHPSYLKEMQAAQFGQRNTTASVEDAGETAAEAENTAGVAATEPEQAAAAANDSIEAAAAVPAAESAPQPVSAEPETTSSTDGEPAPLPKTKEKKGRAPKLQLPEVKVKMTAIVKEFTTVPNHFADEDDEVIIYEAAAILEPPLEIGDAWSSHSATLKKLELEVGDVLTFEAKIAAKKLTKHPVPYKINNPSKLQKTTPEA
ncbi:hypothetical protein PaecuDRAFT_4451 [Paenibacillus curdlanolyticus YK9]|uniref:Uncharacterized protein n=1 Tax=Paenibacillus curdlanolyticus YK9 TaxID=717606 RepID=E0IFU6_9BACL|nr:hypothetical protein [Paenibacillus curdlanolyticus]EFM08657.1 hypothetical protein PaecuDRAFT_4451 [Paenibacillus curdlanolyticus YK9]